MKYHPHFRQHHNSNHHHNLPSHLGIQLFSVALTGAFHHTENYLRDFNMHIGGHRRIGHSPDNNKDKDKPSHHLHLDNLKKAIPKWHHTTKKEDVVVEDLSKELIPIIGKTRFAIVVRNLFTPEECANLIELAEAKGFEDALIHGPDGKEILRDDVRKCGRCIIDDSDLSELWFERVMHVLDGKDIKEKFVTAPWTAVPTVEGHEVDSNLRVVGINERLRFLRYNIGDHFNKHQDNHYIRGEEFGDKKGEVSQLTFLLYLSEKMKGGETRIGGKGRFVDVCPKVGSVLIFDQDIMHESSPITKGVKYVCRSDFMYRNTETSK